MSGWSAVNDCQKTAGRRVDDTMQGRPVRSILRLPAPTRMVALGAAATALTLAAPGGAAAAGCQGAPGTSALEQYCEAIPDAKGGRNNPGDARSGAKGSSGSSSGSGVSRSTSQALQSAGADGAAVASLAGGSSGGGSGKGSGGGGKSGSSKSSDGSSGSGAGGSSGSGAGGAGGAGGGSGTGGGGAVVAPADPSNSPLKATTKAVAGGPTVGSEFVWGLVGMSAIGAVAAVILRRNRGTVLLDEDSSD